MFGDNSKISWAEAESVIRQYRMKAGLGQFVDASVLAESLNITESELAGLRAESCAQSTKRAGSLNLFADRSAWLSVGVTALVMASIGIGMSIYMRHGGSVMGSVAINNRDRAIIREVVPAEPSRRMVVTGLRQTSGNMRIIEIKAVPASEVAEALPGEPLPAKGPNQGI